MNGKIKGGSVTNLEKSVPKKFFRSCLNENNLRLSILQLQSLESVLLPLLDNDRPSVNASHTSPVEGLDQVILTCVANPSDVITGYVWYANSDLIKSATNIT